MVQLFQVNGTVEYYAPNPVVEFFSLLLFDAKGVENGWAFSGDAPHVIMSDMMHSGVGKAMAGAPHAQPLEGLGQEKHSPAIAWV